MDTSNTRRGKKDARPPAFDRQDAARVKHKEDVPKGRQLIDMADNPHGQAGDKEKGGSEKA